MYRKLESRQRKRWWPNTRLTLLVDGLALPWLGMLIGSVGPCGGVHHVRCDDDGRNMVIGLMVVPLVLAVGSFNIAMLIDWIVYRCTRQSAHVGVVRSVIYPPPPQWVRDPTDARRWRWWDGRQYTHHTSSDEVLRG